MLESNTCYSGFIPPRIAENLNNCEKMKNTRESDENFTNFRISEILKPDFGRKQLTTGVLNLSCHRNTHGQTNGRYNNEYNSSHRLNPLNGLQFNIYAQDRLNVTNLEIQKNLQNTTLHTNSRNRANTFNRNSGLSLDLTNASEKHYSHSPPNSVRHRDAGGSGCESDESSPAHSPSGSPGSSSESSPGQDKNKDEQPWPAWVYCTRYSDRPSAGPRSRKIRRKERTTTDDKRPRTAFSTEQLRKLKQEFDDNKYLSESRRQQLARDLNLNESQIKIWFQNKRAKIKKNTGDRHGLAIELLSQGLYNHKTVKVES